MPENGSPPTPPDGWPVPAKKCLVQLEGTWWVCARCGGRYETVTQGQQADCGATATPLPEGSNAPRSDDRAVQASRPVGRVVRSPGGDSVRLELTPEEVAELANRILVAMSAAPDLEPTTQVWIAMLFLATAQLAAVGVPHTEVIQLVTVAWNGKETGLFRVVCREEDERRGGRG